MASVGKKKSQQQAKKVTQHELHLLRQADQKNREKMTIEQRNKAQRNVSEEEYASQVDVVVDNREDALVDARSVDAALQQMSLTSTSVEEDRHPEKYVCMLSCACACIFI